MGNYINRLKDNYSQIPNDLIYDESLSDRARFVYCWMASKPTGWDFYLTPMSKNINCSIDTLRKYIKELVDAGWLTKGEQSIGNGGKFGSVEYCLEIYPHGECSSSDNTVSEKVRHGKMSTLSNTDDLVIQINSNKKKNNNENFDFKKSLIDYGFNLDLVNDWLKVRKTKKATNTQTAYNEFVNQVEKSNIDKNEILKLCVSKDWRGFNVKWLENISEITANQNKRQVDGLSQEEINKMLHG